MFSFEGKKIPGKRIKYEGKGIWTLIVGQTVDLLFPQRVAH